jgi:hypothetical protein
MMALSLFNPPWFSNDTETVHTCQRWWSSVLHFTSASVTAGIGTSQTPLGLQSKPIWESSTRIESIHPNNCHLMLEPSPFNPRPKKKKKGGGFSTKPGSGAGFSIARPRSFWETKPTVLASVMDAIST